MTMRETDELLAFPRGSVNDAIDYFRRLGTVKRWSNFIEYLEEVYATASRVGLDPAIVVAQAAHETGNFTSRWWEERLNAAGLGITGIPEQNEASHWFEDGVDSARAQMTHLMLYAAGKPSFPLMAGDDPRYDAYVQANGNQGVATTLQELGGGRWAVDPEYGEKVASKGNYIFPNIEDSHQAEGPIITPAKGTYPLRVAGFLWDGTDDVIINGNPFYGDRRIVTVGVDILNIRAYASTRHYSPTLRRAHEGERIEVIGWTHGEKVQKEDRWWIGADHTRIWVGGTIEKPERKEN